MKSKKSYNKILVLFSIIVVSVLMTGCNGGAPPLINIFSASPPTINQGESSILTWSVSDADTVNITPGVGTVDSSGSTSVSPEVTTVYTLIATNSAGSVTATKTVTVSSVAVTGVTLDQATMTLTAGGATGTLVATVAPANATNKSVTWSSSAPAVATVANGVVTPLTAGTTTVTVTTVDGGFTATCAVTVNPAPVAVGDSYGGGIVAYILQSGDPGYDESVQHGLIAATSDQGSAEWGCSSYSCGYVEIGCWYNCSNLGTKTCIGTGQSNTTKIVTWLISHSETGMAAQLCDYYSITVDDVTYSDWFLPSIDELNKLYINRVAIGGLSRQYWSSSERGAYSDSAWLWDFVRGVKLYTLKYLVIYSVRAVRAF